MIALAILLTGLLAGLSMQSGEVGFFGETSVGVGGGVAVAVIVASALAMVVRRRMVLAGLSVTAAVVAGISALLFPSALAAVPAGGVLLGCAAVQANRRSLQAVLIGSYFLGSLSAGAIEALQYRDVPRRYADYLGESQLGPPVVVPVLCAVVVLATVWVARVDRDDSPKPSRDVRTMAAALLIGIGGWLLDILFVRSVFGGNYGFEGRWFLGLLIVPVLFAAAALLPGRGGVMVLAGSAILLTSSTTAGVGFEVSDGVWTLGLVALTAVSVAAGTALGSRWGRPLIGIAVLSVVCVTALFESPPLDNVNFVASLVIFPAAAAYLYVSCLPADPAPLVLGLAVPAAITVPIVVTYGWTAYTPLTSAISSTSWLGDDLLLSTGAAFATVVLAGVGMWALGRRPSQQSAPGDS